MSFRYHPLPLKELPGLKFRRMTLADYDAFPGIADKDAMIAHLELPPDLGEAWIIDGNNLWIIAIDGKGNHTTTIYSLEQWELADTQNIIPLYK